MANVFTGDSDVVALWRFENNLLDSIGNNDLGEVGSLTWETTDPKEGSYALDCPSGSFASIADTSLDEGFPGRNTNGTDVFSICLWGRLETISGVNNIISKFATDNWGRSWCIRITDNPNYWKFTIGYNISSYEDAIMNSFEMSANKWYHVAACFDSTDGSYLFRIYDADADTVYNKSGTFTNWANWVSYNDSWVVVGARSDYASYWDGDIDEVVVFKRFLTTTHIDAIRNGTYGAAAPAGVNPGKYVMALM